MPFFGYQALLDFLIVDHNLGILIQRCKTILLFWICFESLLSHFHLPCRTLPWLASSLGRRLFSDLLDEVVLLASPSLVVVLLVYTAGAHLSTPLVNLEQHHNMINSVKETFQ